VEDASKKRGWQWIRLVSYIPLVVLGLEILWVVVLFLGLIFMVGDEPFVNTPAKDRIFDLLAAIPVTVGLVVGVVATAMRLLSRKLEWICLIAGTVICALVVLDFLWS
jgi:hypothetical protein